MRALIGSLVLAMLATPVLAAVEREDVIMLGADGRDYTSYKTLRSDLSERLLYLGPDESPADALFIVPSDYQSTRLADGGTRLRFDSGSYAIMNTGRFDAEVGRADNGDLVFTSWNGITRADGHLGKWNSPDDFASFAYSWVLPANIEVVSYRANRPGDWMQRGRTLSWHGENVNDIAFTIRYRVTPVGPATPTPARETPPPGKSEPSTHRELPLPKRQRMTAPRTRLQNAPATSIVAPEPAAEPVTQPEPAPAKPAAAKPEPDRSAEPVVADTPPSPAPETTATPADDGPRSVRLSSVVILSNGKPRVTARGHTVLDRLAAALGAAGPDSVLVIGPHIADSRDTGGSAAQAARVADYLGGHGVTPERIDIRPGPVQGAQDGRSVEIRVTPGTALDRFRAPD
ncbi:hypothetical protein T31B1_04325 [Salinisphaera sp. T31B1]